MVIVMIGVSVLEGMGGIGDDAVAVNQAPQQVHMRSYQGTEAPDRAAAVLTLQSMSRERRVGCQQVRPALTLA